MAFDYAHPCGILTVVRLRTNANTCICCILTIFWAVAFANTHFSCVVCIVMKKSNSLAVLRQDAHICYVISIVALRTIQRRIIAFACYWVPEKSRAAIRNAHSNGVQGVGISRAFFLAEWLESTIYSEGPQSAKSCALESSVIRIKKS